LLAACQQAGVEFIRMDDLARELLANRAAIPVRDQVLGPIEGRSGVVAMQAA
jgi:undecaprenyl phosphate-alpha-L-ara4FN deformylase